MAKNMQAQSKSDKIKAAVEFIEAYYDQPITISDIAYEIDSSAGYLAHRFKEQMGVTLIGYLTNMRIERAKNLLLTTDKKCCNLYYEVGYNSQTYFAHKFKELAEAIVEKITAGLSKLTDKLTGEWFTDADTPEDK